MCLSSQVSERIVLSQKAYILFYIKSPTNGHAVPAALAQHAQQLSKGLNSLQAAAALKGSSPATAPTAPNGPSVPHSRHSAPAPVFGPAQRPATALLAAKQLHDELLASPTKAPHMVKADSKQEAATPAAESNAHVTSQPMVSPHQLPTAETKGRATSSGPSASYQQADADATADGDKQRQQQPAKRKAVVLGSGKRPSMMQKMNAAGVDAAADAKAGAEQVPKKKRKKLSTDQPTAAATDDRGQAGAQLSGDGLGSGTQAPVSAEHAAPDVGTQSSQERNASQGTGGSCRYADTACWLQCCCDSSKALTVNVCKAVGSTA